MTVAIKITAAAALAALAAAPAVAQRSGPVAVYWVSANTNSGMLRTMGLDVSNPEGGAPPQPEQPKRPGLGSIMGSMASGLIPGMGGVAARQQQEQQEQYERQYGGRTGRGGRVEGPKFTRTLRLDLGSTLQASGEPAADHFIPAGLGMGASLPLETPREAARPSEPGMPSGSEERRPRGKVMIYWGCGEHAAAPPIVIDFANMKPGDYPQIPRVAVEAERPPASGRSATYGAWPNTKSATPVPPTGSLVGEHVIRGNYSPEIHFALGPDHDFMAPLNISAPQPTPGGGGDFSWNAVPGSTGYYAWFMGSAGGGGRPGGEDTTTIFWSSSARPNMLGALTDYLPPSEVRRLIAQNIVMPPSQTECVVPQEVMQNRPMGMLSMIAYGDEANFANPPRPPDPKAAWDLKWVVKVRFKSTSTTMLGMPDMGMR